MIKKPINIVLTVCFLCSMAALIISLLNAGRFKKTGYADTVRLFNEYRLKLDMEAQEEGTLGAIRHKGDSLRAIYDIMIKDPRADRQTLKNIQEGIMEMASAFDQEYSRSNKDINEKVWSRLNPDIHAFSEKKGLELLLGANGMGAVLYGDQQHDYTTELIAFVNKRYINGN